MHTEPMGLMLLTHDQCIEAWGVWDRDRGGYLELWAIETQSASSWLSDPLVIHIHSSGFALGSPQT